MELAIVGLGRMGANMARRLHNAGHRVIAYNRSFEKTQEIMAEGLDGAEHPAEIGAMLKAPRIVWLMVPAGAPTESTMEEFAALLAPGDTIVDGGNSNFKDSKRRHALMKERGALRYMLPWLPADMDEIDDVFGGDPWPYGVEANRPTLEALVQYMVEQHFIARRIPIEELFVVGH